MLGIQQDKFGVIWSSFARSSAPDGATAAHGFWSVCFWLVFFAVLWDFLALNEGIIFIKAAPKI